MAIDWDKCAKDTSSSQKVSNQILLDLKHKIEDLKLIVKTERDNTQNLLKSDQELKDTNKDQQKTILGLEYTIREQQKSIEGQRQTIDNFVVGQSGSMSSLEELMNSVYAGLHEKMTESFQSLPELKDEANSLRQKSLELNEQLTKKTTLLEEREKVLKAYEEKVGKITAGKSGIDGQIGQLKEKSEKLTKEIDAIKKQKAVLEEKLQKSTEEISKLKDELSCREVPENLIVGMTNTTGKIQEILDKTKRSILIFLPSIREINMLDLSKIPSSKNIRIGISRKNFDINNDAAFISEMQQKPNAEIRELSYENIFAIARDGEELLLAPLSQKTGKPGGMVFAESQLLEWFGGVLQSTWAKSKKFLT